MDDFFGKITLDTKKTIPDLFGEAMDKVPMVTVPLPIYDELVSASAKAEALIDYIAQNEKHAYVDKHIVASILGYELPKEDE